MPKAAEKQVKKQGGIARYRTLKNGDKLRTCAVTKKAGPGAVCWPRESRAVKVVNRLLNS